MIVDINVYTKDLAAATEAFTVAVKHGATDVHLNTSEHYKTKKLEYFQLRFTIDHQSPAISHLENGFFVRESEDLFKDNKVH